AACRHNENRRAPEDQEQCEEYFRSFAVRLMTISSRAHLLQFTPPRPSRGESRNLGLKTLNFVSRGFPTPPLPLKWKFEFSQGKQRSMPLKKSTSIKHGSKHVSAILNAHERFFSGRAAGIRADLTGADLNRGDVSGMNVSGAI